MRHYARRMCASGPYAGAPSSPFAHAWSARLIGREPRHSRESGPVPCCYTHCARHDSAFNFARQLVRGGMFVGHNQFILCRCSAKNMASMATETGANAQAYDDAMDQYIQARMPPFRAAALPRVWRAPVWGLMFLMGRRAAPHCSPDVSPDSRSCCAQVAVTRPWWLSDRTCSSC